MCKCVLSSKQWAGFVGDLTGKDSAGNSDPHPHNSWVSDSASFKTLMGPWASESSNVPKSRSDRSGFDGDSSGGGGD